jgi:DHA2 family multidrug resistance protein
MKLDYVGIALLTLGVGALQILLDKGQEDDWFGSRFITTLIITSAVCLISLVVWEWFAKTPIIDVRMFKSFNFASASLMMFMLGILLFSALVLMPQFLQTLLGYTSQLAGFALSVGGFVLLMEMPIMGQLTTKIQARRLIGFGWLALSIAMFYSTKRIDLEMSFSAATWLRITQVIGLGFLFVPITLVAYVGVAPEKNNSVAGIVNFMRNMGSSVGTSLVTTLIARRSQFHQLRLVEKARVDNPNFAHSVQGLTHRFMSGGLGKHEALATAYARIYQTVQAQAASLAYIDTFMVLCVAAAIMFCLSFLLEKNDPGGGGAHVAE